MDDVNLSQSLKELASTEDSEKNRDLLRAAARQLEHRNERVSIAEARRLAGDLEKHYGKYTQSHTFAPGQLVAWKKGLKNRRRPTIGEPAIVIEVLNSPILDVEADPGLPYFREPLDIILGVIDEDGDFLRYHFDSRRFEPFRVAENPGAERVA